MVQDFLHQQLYQNLMQGIVSPPQEHRRLDKPTNQTCSGARVYIGEYVGDYYRVIKGETRSLDYSSFGIIFPFHGSYNQLWLSLHLELHYFTVNPK